jgi:signal transduction histidine kinase
MLALCKEIIELHGGQLTIDSKRGAGTIMTIRVPLMMRHKPERIVILCRIANCV